MHTYLGDLAGSISFVVGELKYGIRREPDNRSEVGLPHKPHAPGGTAMNETYEGLKVVYTEDESVYTKRAAKVEDYLGQQLEQ